MRIASYSSRVVGLMASTFLYLPVFLWSANGTLAAELTEGYATAWATFASDNAVSTVSNDTTHVKVGTQSIKFVTASGFDAGVRYPAVGSANLNLAGKNLLRFCECAHTT